jgi:chromate transporter
MMWRTLLDLALVMSKLGLSSLAGSGTIVGELGREAAAHGWMTTQQFAVAYALSQLAPGPGTLVVLPIGYQAAGILGALVALVAFVGPTSLLAAGAVTVWARLRGAPWAQMGRTALMPVAAGLIFGGVFTLARASLTGLPGLVIGLAAFVVIWRARVPTVAVVCGGMALGIAGGALGW